MLDIGSAQPVDFGNFYELYAIAAAVLGGCSLRGGEGSIFGIALGAALMRMLMSLPKYPQRIGASSSSVFRKLSKYRSSSYGS